NRVALWSARREPERARADLERARELARRLGHAVPERNTSYNLAEYLYWTGGRGADALALGRRACTLQERCVGPPIDGRGRCARILLASGEPGGAGAELAAARAAAAEATWPAHLRLLARMVELARAPDAAPDAWDALER